MGFLIMWLLNLDSGTQSIERLKYFKKEDFPLFLVKKQTEVVK